MMRLLLSGLLAASLGAGDSPLLAQPEAERLAAVRALLAPGQVVLPAGTISLAAAVDLLAAGGNRVVLAEGLDERREALLPAFSGLWWDGVGTVCRAFSLRFDQGIVSGDRLEGDGNPLPIGHGGLVLQADPSGPPAFSVCGAVAVVAETDTRPAGPGQSLLIRVWARAEPHIPRGRLPWGRATEEHIEAVGGNSFPLLQTGKDVKDESDTRPPVLFYQTAIGQSELSTLSIHLSLRIGTLERWTARSELRLGDQAELPVAGQILNLALFGEGSPALWKETVLPERRPLLAILGPEALLKGCQVRLLSGGQDLASGSSAASGKAVRNALFRFPRKLPDAPVEALLEGGLAVVPAPNRVVFSATPRHQVTSPDQDAPSRLRWAAGSLPLSHWIAQLAAGGNLILPEVGLDTTTLLTLPALDGVFWDGVLLVCAAADLAPAPTAKGAIASGPLRLIRRQGRPLIASACGPLLVVMAQAPVVVNEGQERNVLIRLALIAEPRSAADHLLAPAIAWASYAEDQDGLTAQVQTPLIDDGNGPLAARLRQGRNRLLADPADFPTSLAASVRVPRPQSRSVALAGLVMMQRARGLHATAELPIGGSVELVLDDRPIELSTNGGADGAKLPEVGTGSGLILRGGSGLENLTLTASGEDGVSVEFTDESGRMIPLGREPGLRLVRCKLPPSGNLTVDVTARESCRPLALPLRLVVPLP